MPRYLDCSYSGGTSILTVLSRNYPVSAFPTILAEKVYWFVGKELFVEGERVELDRDLLRDLEG